ncbi:hypothetical protein ACLKA6_016910 [Drosophila palustris]
MLRSLPLKLTFGATFDQLTFSPLPNQQDPTPYVFVADDAFALKPYIMKPFSFRNLKSGVANESDFLN